MERDKLDILRVKLDILRLVADIADRESDRFYARYRVMLYTSTGLLAVFAWSLNQSSGYQQPVAWAVAPLITAFIGGVVALIWHNSVVLGRFYELRWLKDFDAIIESEPDLAEWICGRNPCKRRISRPKHSNVVKLLQNVPLLFFILWFIGAVFTLLALQGVFGTDALLTVPCKEITIAKGGSLFCS